MFYLDKTANKHNIKEHIEEIRILCRNYESVNETFRELQLKFRSIVDLIFPRYDTFFSSGSSKLCDTSFDPYGYLN